MKVKKILSILLVALTATVSAQDIHFSQYYASPLNLNPANTGNFNGKFRLAANYRQQWFSFLQQSSFRTLSGSVDAPVYRNKKNYDQLGVGLVVYNDKSGDGGLTNLTVMVGAAYHKSLDDFNRYSISVGFQAGIVQKRIDFSKLLFASQFDGEDFNPLQWNGESVNGGQSFIYPDFSLGVAFRAGFTKNTNAYIGASMTHLHKPKESFLGDEESKIEPRINVHGGIDISIGEYLTLTPGLLYKIQGAAQQVTAGLVVGYSINKLNSIYFGGYYRASPDAAIIMAAYEVEGFRLGLSYDINTSELKEASNSIGAVEVSLIYVYGKEEPKKFSPVKFCPRF